MIITDSFVYLNFPKTGSSFVRKVLRELHRKQAPVPFWQFWKSQRAMEEFEAPNLRIAAGPRRGAPTPHGCRWQIPEAASGLPVVSGVRDPFERAWSAYRYADWKKPEALLAPESEIRKIFPNFPELSFPEFLAYQNTFPPRRLQVGGRNCGSMTTAFVYFFLEEPPENQGHLSFDTVDEVRNSISEVDFLPCEELNGALAGFLSRFGYSGKELDHVLHRDPVNVAGKKEIDPEREEVRAQVTESEWLFYELFPRYQ